MKVSQDAVEDRQATLNIEMEPEDMEGYLDRAYRRLVQRLSIPGFRKGKAPRQVVEGYVGRGGLLNEALDFLVPEATNKAIQQETLEVVGQPNIELVELDPVTIKVTVPLTPVVELGPYRDLRMDGDPVEVTEEQVNEVLERVRLELAPWEPVERPVKFDDLVTLDLKGEADGRTVVENRELPFIPRKDSPVPLPGFSEKLEGMTIRETREFDLTFPDDYSDATLRGKECHFTTKALEMKEKNPAHLDDEFAKGVGAGYDTLEALKEKFRTDLLEEGTRAAQRRLEEQVLDAVVEQTHFELSPMMVDHDIDHLFNEEAEALERQQLSLEQYLSSVGKTPEQLREELRDPAVRRLQRSLTLVKVAEAESIEIGAEDIQGEIDTLVSGSGDQGDTIRQLFDTENGRESIGRRMLTRRTLERLTTIARGEPVDAPKETAKAASKKRAPVAVKMSKRPAKRKRGEKDAE